jgi:hypothetical protein
VVNGQKIPTAAIRAVTVIPAKWIQRRVGDLSRSPRGRPRIMKMTQRRCMIINISAVMVIHLLWIG